ncbi:hypothetical protein V1478_001592 [Vespula squamosa]|uniref:Uncharacterized protein n=1 Tax=Vespula squamosa TaxID=30214 RepID=A0ABD2C1X1_VESSQ
MFNKRLYINTPLLNHERPKPLLNIVKAAIMRSSTEREFWKREKAIDSKTAINVAQNLPDADSRCVYFTCKYYSMTRDRKHSESLKYL